MALINLLTDLSSFYNDNPYSKKYKANSPYATMPYALSKGSFDQKSLKFGVGTASDRPGGGHSNQPFVTITAENSFDLSKEDLAHTGGKDMFIRGGSLLLKHIKNDEVRISKFLASPTGLLWITQQEGLTKHANSYIHLPGDIFPYGFRNSFYNPASTLIQIAGGSEGLHVNRQGLNPLSFGDQNSYYNKTTPILGETDNYSSLSKNRLVLLADSKIYNLPIDPSDRDRNKALKGFNISRTETFIVGKNLRVTNTFKDTSTFNREMESSSNFSTLTSLEFPQQNVLKSQGSTALSNIGDFREKVPQDEVQFKSFLAQTKYQNFNLQKTYGISDPGNKGLKDVTKPYNVNSTDELNALSIYSSQQVNSDYSNSDLCPFYFQVINNDDPSIYEFIHFRAYLGGIQDTYGAAWSSHTYSGRGETFYTYGNFSRGLTFGFKVAVESYGEQKSQYEKLNFLASTLAPDYSDAGYMRGNLIKITIGDYLSEIPGFITSLTYNISEESPWDIGRNIDGEREEDKMILPQIIDVSVSFTPLHNFLPRKSRNWDTILSEENEIINKVTAPFISMGKDNQGYKS